MAVDAEEAGMDAFLEKPFKLEELTAVYIKLLERDRRNQRDLSSRQLAVATGIEAGTITLGPLALGPRSIRKITPNAKIFVDSKEFDDMIAYDSLKHDRLLPPIAGTVSESERIGKGKEAEINSAGHILPDIGSGLNRNSTKVYASLN